MKTLLCKNQENPSDGISHAWAPLKCYFLAISCCVFDIFCRLPKQQRKIAREPKLQPGIYL
jgi:hypothetical protein